MELKSLARITKSLKDVFSELESCDVKDHAIRHRYAEFFAAAELRKQGHTIQLLDEREDKTADIYLPDTKQRVEIKSGKTESDDWAYASFGTGRQIKGKKFDYCVFVIFSCEGEKVKEVFVFTRNELKEVARARKRVARYESTNPCILMCAPTLKDFDDWTQANGVKAWKVERALRNNPAKFRQRWDKIKLAPKKLARRKAGK